MGLNVVGLIPAAGTATRMSGLPKFLLPCPGGYLLDRLACAMHDAGAREVCIAANTYNHQFIEAYMPPGCMAYIAPSKTMREAVMGASRWHASRPGLLAMPDTYWTDPDILTRLVAALDTCDVAVALWKVRPEQRPLLGMCDIDSAFSVLRVDDKPQETALQFAWGALAFRAPFWYVMDQEPASISESIQGAIDGGLNVKAVLAQGHYWDCGTPEEYFKLASTWNGRAK
jgi:dTDP-glucose pyrophosphorylase